MDVSVIIVNYNTAAILPDCLNSVLKQTGVRYEIIVIDNLSQDHSHQVLDDYADRIIPIKNSDNVGFGRANNQAFKKASGRYVFLLNPDATFESPTDLQEMVAFMDMHPEYGLAGTRVLKANLETESLPALFYPGEKKLSGVDFKNLPGDIAWVLGASMIVRHEIYTAVKGFDEDYFLYGEEADLCLRIRKQGYAIGYHDQVAVKHIGGASEKRTPTEQLWRKKQNGLHLFYRKHYPYEQVIRLVKKNGMRAYFRFTFLKWRQLFSTLNEKKLAKLIRYKTVYEISKDFLSHSNQGNQKHV